jgi:hypothetical protein
MTEPEIPSAPPPESEPDSKSVPVSTESPSVSRRQEARPTEPNPAQSDPPPTPERGPNGGEKPPDDPDAPLDIPWKGVVIFLVLAWAFFRFSWLVFKAGG